MTRQAINLLEAYVVEINKQLKCPMYNYADVKSSNITVVDLAVSEITNESSPVHKAITLLNDSGQSVNFRFINTVFHRVNKVLNDVQTFGASYHTVEEKLALVQHKKDLTEIKQMIDGKRRRTAPSMFDGGVASDGVGVDMTTDLEVARQQVIVWTSIASGDDQVEMRKVFAEILKGALKPIFASSDSDAKADVTGLLELLATQLGNDATVAGDDTTLQELIDRAADATSVAFTVGGASS